MMHMEKIAQDMAKEKLEFVQQIRLLKQAKRQTRSNSLSFFKKLKRSNKAKPAYL